MSGALFSLEGLTLAGSDVPRLNSVTLRVFPGATAIVGLSGAGKTSLLHVLAGFETEYSGEFRTMPASEMTTVDAHRLPLFWVPQSGGLWPHLTVAQHVSFVRQQSAQSKDSKMESQRFPKKTDEILSSLDLLHRQQALPAELSQGERSRLALARALATRANVLLLDEPLSHVDPVRKPAYWSVLRRIVTEENLSMVFTSHEPETVLRQADHVICLKEGAVAFQGPLRTLYDNPPDRHVGAFLGPLNWFRAEEAALFLDGDRQSPSDVAVRPERLQMHKADDSAIELLSMPFIGAYSESHVRHVTSGMTISVQHQVPEASLLTGQRVGAPRVCTGRKHTMIGFGNAEWGKRATRVPASRCQRGDLCQGRSRWGGTARSFRVPGSEIGAWIAMLVCLIFAGCEAPITDPELSFARFDTWKVPASGRFLPAPRGLYADENDTVYVLDDAGRVLVYNSTGKLMKQWEMPEFTAGKPEGVWKLLDGRVAVADTHYHRVVIFYGDGTVSHKFGTQGTGPGEFVFPVTIAQDPKGYIYVGEYGDRQRIQKFKVDGTFVLEFGQHGSKEGEFQRPSGVAWQDGLVYVVDAFNDRIQVFEDGGKFVRVISLPEKSAPLEYPYDIRVDRRNQIYVIENKAARLTVMRLDGTIVGRYGRPGRGLDQFYQPWDLTVLSDGRILVADTGNHRLVELTP